MFHFFQNTKGTTSKYETKEGLKLLKKGPKLEETKTLSKSVTPKPKYVFKPNDNSVIIQSYSEENKKNTNSSSGEVFDFANLSNIAKELGEKEFVIKSGEPSAVVSEIKISSSPNNEETEAMVASTLLTVSSRVRDRLLRGKVNKNITESLEVNDENDKNLDDQTEATVEKEDPQNKLKIQKEVNKTSKKKKSTSKEEAKKIFEHILQRTNSGIKSGKNMSSREDKTLVKKMGRFTEDPEEEFSSNGINDWKPIVDFVDSSIWSGYLII